MFVSPFVRQGERVCQHTHTRERVRFCVALVELREGVCDRVNAACMYDDSECLLRACVHYIFCLFFLCVCVSVPRSAEGPRTKLGRMRVLVI